MSKENTFRVLKVVVEGGSFEYLIAAPYRVFTQCNVKDVDVDETSITLSLFEDEKTPKAKTPCSVAIVDRTPVRADEYIEETVSQYPSMVVEYVKDSYENGRKVRHVRLETVNSAGKSREKFLHDMIKWGSSMVELPIGWSVQHLEFEKERLRRERMAEYNQRAQFILSPSHPTDDIITLAPGISYNISIKDGGDISYLCVFEPDERVFRHGIPDPKGDNTKAVVIAYNGPFKGKDGNEWIAFEVASLLGTYHIIAQNVRRGVVNILKKVPQNVQDAIENFVCPEGYKQTTDIKIDTSKEPNKTSFESLMKTCTI